MDEHMEKSPHWILMIFLSPIAIVLLMLIALVILLRFLLKVALLFIIVAMTTPFAMMYNVSILVWQYYTVRFRNSIARFGKPSACFRKSSRWNWSDPRASLGIEVQIIVSDFFKVVAGELLLGMSTGIITYFTAPKEVFYASTVVWLVAICHKWLNTDCLSKTAISCLCGGYGLNPMMFFFSYIGVFHIGCHPIAKCSFVANRAFLFEKNGPYQFNKEDVQNPIHSGNLPQGRLFRTGKGATDSEKESLEEACRHRFNGVHRVAIDAKQEHVPINFKWNAFERGLFQLNPKIDFINRNLEEKYILKSFMVLKLFDRVICEYPVERLELPEDYSKANELRHFLVTLSSNEGFVTDRMRGRYEHSLTLSQIVEGVEENDGYNIVDPKEKVFVVAGCTR